MATFTTARAPRYRAQPSFDRWALTADWLAAQEPYRSNEAGFEPAAYDLRLPRYDPAPLLVFLFTLAVFLMGFLSTLFLFR